MTSISLSINDLITIFRDTDNESNIETEKLEKDQTEYEKAVLCAYCSEVVTKPSCKIEVQGSHLHTFTNPHGIIYRVLCYMKAWSVESITLPENQWSWFKGYSWQVLICSSCLEHLGWYYTASNQDPFYGFIVEKLRFTG